MAVLLRDGNMANNIERDVTCGTSVVEQIELTVANRIVRLVTIIADSTQHQAIDTIFSCDMGNCRALHANAIGMRRLDSVVAHGSARHKAVARGNRTDQELFGAFVRSDCICRSINKPTLSKHIGGNIDQRRRRGKLLESRCRLGPDSAGVCR